MFSSLFSVSSANAGKDFSSSIKQTVACSGVQRLSVFAFVGGSVIKSRAAQVTRHSEGASATEESPDTFLRSNDTHILLLCPSVGDSSHFVL